MTSFKRKRVNSSSKRANLLLGNPGEGKSRKCGCLKCASFSSQRVSSQTFQDLLEPHGNPEAAGYAATHCTGRGSVSSCHSRLPGRKLMPQTAPMWAKRKKNMQSAGCCVAFCECDNGRMRIKHVKLKRTDKNLVILLISECFYIFHMQGYGRSVYSSSFPWRNSVNVELSCCVK